METVNWGFKRHVGANMRKVYSLISMIGFNVMLVKNSEEKQEGGEASLLLHEEVGPEFEFSWNILSSAVLC